MRKVKTFTAMFILLTIACSAMKGYAQPTVSKEKIPLDILVDLPFKLL